MRKKIPLLLGAVLVIFYAGCKQPVAPPAPYGVLPSKGQLNWQELEMICIVHFGLNTFTDKEWGYGNVDPKAFNPSHFDPGQIVSAAKAAGIKGLILVCKHHDGFCLWPTKTTEYNISKSPWADGKGDVVKSFQAAVAQQGLQFGVYCSPWDRNNPAYGTEKYVTLYREQLRELYTNYGKLFESWHDGANGGDGYYGGANEVRKIDRSTYYGWDSTWLITKALQPDAVIFSDAGPGVRWVGNENGYAADTTWETFTPEGIDGAKPAPGVVKYQESPAGTRDGKYWLPAECDVPLRPGWFYHESQEGQAKSPARLFDIYLHSVGRAGNMNLGLSPDKRGMLSDDDTKTLKDFGELLRKTFSDNLAKGADLKASNVRGSDVKDYGPAHLLDDDRYSYWATDNEVTTPELTLDLHAPKTFNIIQLRENIKLGQRIYSVAIDEWKDGKWNEIATATGIGANRLIRLPAYTTTDKVRLRITKSPVCIALSSFGLYAEPETVSTPQVSRNRRGYVSISTPMPVSAIHYTTDGTDPTLQSPVFGHPFPLEEGGIVKAISADKDGHSSPVSVKDFGISKDNWKIIGAAAQNNTAVNFVDENEHSLWQATAGTADIEIDLGQKQSVKAFAYLPRQDQQADGIIDKYAFYVSNDGKSWQKAAAGEFSNIRANPVQQLVQLSSPVTARYIKFQPLHVVAGDRATGAELDILVK